MSQDLLRRLAPLDPVEEAAVARDVREMWAEIVARVAAAPAPGVPRRWIANRRIQALLAAALAIVLVVLTLTAIRPDPTHPGNSTDDGWVVAGFLADLRIAEITYLESARVFVIARPGDLPYALSAISPHSPYGYEEGLLYCRPSETFEEPQHGAKFDIGGDYLVGPSPSGMFGIPLRITDGDRVEVDPASPLPGAPRESRGGDLTLCPARARWSEPGFVDLGGSGNSLLDMTYWHGPGDDPTAGTFVSTIPGSNCGFEVPSVLQLTVPLGSRPETDAQWRYYAADPTGVWTERLAGSYAPAVDPPSEDPALPATARFTGYRTAIHFELWVDPATFDREIWVVRRELDGTRFVQRWPRVLDLPACAPPGSPS